MRRKYRMSSNESDKPQEQPTGQSKLTTFMLQIKARKQKDKVKSESACMRKIKILKGVTETGQSVLFVT